MNEIDELFKSNEIIYHYTKIQTVYEHILHTHKLRLSDRKNSNDPVENMTRAVLTRSSYYPSKIKSASREEGSEVAAFIYNKIEHAKQLCFCKNNEDPELQKYTVLPTKYYGFCKPRMWDQYGDNYRGACLVFDKKELKEKNPEIYSRDVEYIPYEELHRNEHNIDLIKLSELGVEKYCQDYFKIIRSNSFLKHEDYEGENEFRFISFSEEETFLDIGTSLKAIILSKEYHSDFVDKWFRKYAEQHDVKLFYISWDNLGINIQSKEEQDKTLKWLNELNLELNKKSIN